MPYDRMRDYRKTLEDMGGPWTGLADISRRASAAQLDSRSMKLRAERLVRFRTQVYSEILERKDER